MISSSEGVSDLLFAAGKPPIVEEHGLLSEFPVDTESGVLENAQIEQIAAHIIGGDERLERSLVSLNAQAEPIHLLTLNGSETRDEI